MHLPLTNASTSSASKPSAPERAGTGDLFLLAGLGAALAALHASGDLGLGLPGHFGLIWMAGVVLARAGSTLGLAASTTALGYAASGWGFDGMSLHALGQAPGYLVAAMCLDAAWRLWPGLFRRVWSSALCGGCAFACKPLVMAALVASFEFKAGSLRHGLPFPLLTHFCFGATGAVLGTLAWQAARAGARTRA